MSDNILSLEIPRPFGKAIEKAVDRCNRDGREMKIITDGLTPFNELLYRIEAKNPVHFFHLGKFYATYREEI